MAIFKRKAGGISYDDSSDDETLIKAVLAGDQDAFAYIVKRYEKNVYHTAYLVTGNPEDAMDLSQEVFLRLYSGLSSFRGDSKFFTWLVRISKNTCADWLRKKQRTIRTVSLSPADDEDDAPPFPEPADSDPTVDPVSAAERHEDADTVRAALRSLGDDHRIILTMRDLDGMSYEEIAEKLDISVGTVKSRICRARSQVKIYLEKRNFFEAPSSKKAEESAFAAAGDFKGGE